MRGIASRRRLATAALAAACGLAGLGASPALAAFDLTDVSAKPASPNAGANSDFTVSFDISEPQRDLKKLVVHLPPGLVGNPLATPTCSEAKLKADACSPRSDVGDASNRVTVSPGIPLTASGDVYNVKPRKGEPARFGIILKAAGGLVPPIVLQLPASLRQDDFGLDTTLDNIPRTAGGVGIDVRSVDLTFEGRVGSPAKGFLRNPTSCGTNPVGFDATAYDGSTATAQTSFETVRCNRLPFTPEFSASVVPGKTPEEAVRLSTTISQTIEEAGLKRAKVTLPGDLNGDLDVLLNSCPRASFQAGNCPPSTIVGKARATSPLLSEELSGDVAIVETAPGDVLPQVGVDLRGPLSLKLLGSLTLTEDLRNIVIFDGLPDIPIGDFTLTFDGGPGGLTRAERDLCKPPASIFQADFLAHSEATVQRRVPAEVSCGGKGGDKPKARISLRKRGSGEPSLRLTVKPGKRAIKTAKLIVPKRISVGDGKAFRKGATARADGRDLKSKAIKRSRRGVKVKAGKGGAEQRLKLRLRDGALRAGKDLKRKSNPRFTVKLRDAGGKLTKLSVRAR